MTGVQACALPICTVSTESQVAGGHFVEDGSKREQVCAGIQLFRSRLLWRHVSYCTQGQPRAGELLILQQTCRGGRSCCFAGRARFERHLRQPEIQDLGVPALGHKDVGWLDVAMNDTRRMSGIERIRYLYG